MIPDYGKVYNLGSREVKDIFLLPGEIYIQEKIDGSQFSFMKNQNGKLLCRSRNRIIDIKAPGMFKEAVESLLNILDSIPENRIYRSEYLRKPKHNHIEYQRIPKNHLILFDVENIEDKDELLNFFTKGLFEHLGFVIFQNTRLYTQDEVIKSIKNEMLKPSILGGPREGMVIKKYLPDGTIMKAKIVSDSFKEISGHNKSRKKQSYKLNIGDIISNDLRTESRWEKSLQHAKEDGEIEGYEKDIGTLIKYVFKDIEEECEEYCKDQLWNHYKKNIIKGASRGLAQWYKGKLNQEDNFNG